MGNTMEDSLGKLGIPVYSKKTTHVIMKMMSIDEPWDLGFVNPSCFQTYESSKATMAMASLVQGR